MRTDLRKVVSLVALLGSAACVPPSLSSQVRRVSTLSGAPAELELSDRVEPESGEKVRALLQQPLEVDSAVRIALLNNRELRAELRELGISRGALWAASLPPNPELELSSTLPRGELGAHIEVGASIDLTTLLLRPLATGVAEASYEAARYRAASNVVETIYEVRESFRALQAAQQKWRIANRSLDGLAAARDTAQALYKAGNISELDLANQEAAFESARVTAAHLELETATRREELNRLMGLSGADTRWTIATELPGIPKEAPPTHELETKAIEASLELKALRQQLEASHRRADLARKQAWLPPISVGVFGEHEEDLWKPGAALSIALPVFDRNQGETVAAESQAGADEERLHGLGIDIRSAARSLRDRVVLAHSLVGRFEQTILPSRRKVLAQSQLQYNAMQLSIFQLLQARQSVLDAELAHVEAVREFWTAKAALDALLAGQRVASSTSFQPAPSLAAASETGGH